MLKERDEIKLVSVREPPVVWYLLLTRKNNIKNTNPNISTYHKQTFSRYQHMLLKLYQSRTNKRERQKLLFQHIKVSLLWNKCGPAVAVSLWKWSSRRRAFCPGLQGRQLHKYCPVLVPPPSVMSLLGNHTSWTASMRRCFLHGNVYCIYNVLINTHVGKYSCLWLFYWCIKCENMTWLSEQDFCLYI